MFMFRSRRTTLAKRLWKARVSRGGGDEEAAAVEGLEGGEAPGGPEAALRTLLKHLKEPQLEALATAVESRGAELSACVLLPRDPTWDALLLCCRAWRWPDLRLPCEVKRLPACRATKDPGCICCNPYHWSRLCKPESPPPPYCMLPNDRCRHNELEPSDEYSWRTDRLGSSCYGSVTTNGEGDAGEREWCKLAYWELATRVGRLFSVEVPAVNVFASLPRGDGLCLATLARSLSPVPPHDSVRRTRAKIGLGVMLSLEGDGVWAYNRSDSPIFVNSPTLDGPDTRTLLVYRVPPGHCLNVFDAGRAASFPPRWAPAASGPIDRCSVRISFAKGWGPKYSRQEVTACPCWLEVLLVSCR
ncbi:mothers against decapentaplegic homolog 6 [Bacillus rossius redtenbacheri]|uniref:mothers against decapentaplegic homolog 6 n=1 Tax=Bacillus rossius redtenbacheri TaxID=93214 RepID=UPI002FDDAA5B